MDNNVKESLDKMDKDAKNRLKDMCGIVIAVMAGINLDNILDKVLDVVQDPFGSLIVMVVYLVLVAPFMSKREK